MGTTGLRTWLVVVACFVFVVLFLDSSGVLSEDGEVIVDDAAQLIAGLSAATLCWWTSRRVTGVERNWRRLMAVGMLGWSIGQAFWSWYQIFSDTPLPSPSIADIGYPPCRCWLFQPCWRWTSSHSATPATSSTVTAWCSRSMAPSSSARCSS
jgi:hypothetical protein